MQSLLYLNLLLLILILVLCISSISFSYTDLDSSRLLHSVTASDLPNLSISKVLYRTVLYSDMAPKERMTARKRMFRDMENEGTSSDPQVFHLQNTSIETAVDPFDNVIGNPLLSGQASYQKSKQGVIIEYKDIGDDIFQCIYCNAHFWLDEANKQDSRNAPIIYTGCCQEGQVKLKESNPTPEFLEQLLDSKNGRESILFRENIRVYNSMFSFTSMGAKIDYTINDGSGPYIFKICGQVHHLMG